MVCSQNNQTRILISKMVQFTFLLFRWVWSLVDFIRGISRLWLMQNETFLGLLGIKRFDETRSEFEYCLETCIWVQVSHSNRTPPILKKFADFATKNFNSFEKYITSTSLRSINSAYAENLKIFKLNWIFWVLFFCLSSPVQL